MKSCYKVVPDWGFITDKINKKLGKLYSVNYVQSVYSGHQKNKSISKLLDKIL